MHNPHLIIIAGCNGSGKSTFSSALVKEVIPFDYDKRFLEVYSSLNDSEFKEQIVLNQVTDELNELVSSSINNSKTFCFETNLHVFPFNWIKQAKDKGFNIILYFFSLKNIELAKERVKIRTINNGHYVNDETIEYKWKEGYKNLNLHFNNFDKILFIDNTKLYSPKILFEMNKSNEDNYDILLYSSTIPIYLQKRLPSIFDLIHNS